jgi:hypothetical protein
LRWLANWAWTVPKKSVHSVIKPFSTMFIQVGNQGDLEFKRLADGSLAGKLEGRKGKRQ